jgi:hypothetical protein
VNTTELAELYLELSMRYEEEHFVECGFESATKARSEMYKKILSGSLSNKDLGEIEHVFAMRNINIRAHIKPKKRFIFF